MEDREKLFNKIRGLLRKAEGTDNEHEAQAFLTKAQEWMILYAVDEEILWASEPDKAPKPIQISVEIKDKTGRQWLNNLLGTCAKYNRCQTWSYLGENKVQVVGFESDVLFVEMLYVSLKSHMDLQLAIGLALEARGENARTFRANFYEAYARKIRYRLDEAKQALDHTENTTGASTELVLAGREVKVQQWLDENVGQLRTYSVKSTARHSRGAQALGAEAAKSADITGGRRSVTAPRRELGR